MNSPWCAWPGKKFRSPQTTQKPDDSGMTPKSSALDKKTHAFMEKFAYTALFSCRRNRVSHAEKAHARAKRATDRYFHRVLFPVLTPLAWTAPVPMLANKSLNLAVRPFFQKETRVKSALPSLRCRPFCRTLQAARRRRYTLLILLEDISTRLSWGTFRSCTRLKP